MKKWIHGMALLLCAALLVGVAGCGAPAEVDLDSIPEETLQVYLLMPYDPSVKDLEPYKYDEYSKLSKIIDEYTTTRESQLSSRLRDKIEDINPGRRVRMEITPFFDPDTYQTRILEDIRAGGGPDLMLFTAGAFDRPFYELAKEGLLEDLEPFIREDTGKDAPVMEDYIGPVMEAYVRDGKRLAVPLDIDVDTVRFLSEDTLRLYGLTQPEEAFTSLDIIKLLGEFGAKCANGPEEPFYEYALPGTSAFMSLLRTDGRQWWDPAAGTAEFDTLEFIDFVEAYIGLARAYPSFACPSFAEAYTDRKGAAGDNKLLCSTGEYWMDAVCSKSDGGYTAVVQNYICVSANSQNKELAYDCVKFFMDKDIYYDISINKKRSMENMNEKLKDLSPQSESAADYKRQIDILSNVKRVFIPDSVMQELLENMVTDILDNGADVDNAVAALQTAAEEHLAAKR